LLQLAVFAAIPCTFPDAGLRALVHLPQDFAVANCRAWR
jgi:hypothetical protein